MTTKLRSKLKRLCLRCLKASAILCVLLALSYAFLPKPDLLPTDLEFSRTVLDSHGQVLFLTTTSDGMIRLPTTIDQLPPELIEATLEMEDRRFFDHPGVDPRSIARATWGAATGQKLGGGSTITMQLSRLRWKLSTRSPLGKLEQMFRAIQLERHYSKNEIAAAYFTIAPYGGNVEGARAAAFRWCGKPASELTLREAASLSTIPQSPSTRRPRATGNPALARAQTRLMTRLRANHGEPPNELDAEFHLVPAPIPRQLPHYSRRKLRENPTALAVPTSIELTQQQIIEQSIRDFLARWRPQGLRNACAVLMHAPTREIRASIGSADFLDIDIAGQVDGTRARRSPGSTLKPFIYALALDEGLIQPQTLLDDAPKRFAGYNPENSDRQFLGPIAAAEALRRSRNVPAVDLAYRLPGGGLETFLRGSAADLPTRSHGLALAIGATEMRLEDLAHLYAELADPRRGQLSPEACWLTLDALRSDDPAAPAGLACKTGTSNGFRDAWACGVIGDWVLCVWVGHFNGRAMPGLFASETAAPLLYQTAHRLELAPETDRPRPEDVVRVEVCSVSGDLAGRHCPHCRSGWFIGGVSPIKTCKVHQSHDGQVVEIWSANRLEQFRRAGFPRSSYQTTDKAPEPNTTPPKILSPQSAITYYIQENPHAQQNQLLLEADAAPGIRQIHWFAGQEYLGASPPAEPLPWTPTVGDYELQAIDDAGRVATSKISVRLAVANHP